MGSQKRKYGTGGIDSKGYITKYFDGVRRREHIVIAENALGKPLPEGSQVHHLDENPSNNDPRNLVICPNQSYHSLLHQRTRALQECGNANYLKCQHCKQYDNPERLCIYTNNIYHRKCETEYTRSRSGV